MKLTKNTLINGALSLALGSFLSKILGAIYRVPLTNVIGGEGIGLYQMVFPIYCVLLDFSGAGFPNAISKIISSFDPKEIVYKERKLLVDSVKLSLILGFLGFILMLLLSNPIARLQGDKSAYLGYIFLSPAVLAVSLISCFRGYFQGKLNMTPTAVSQVLEQGVKLIFGLILTKLFMPNVALAVGGATLAVTISEIFALFYLIIVYKIKNRKIDKEIKFFSREKFSFFDNAKLIIKTAIPITLISIVIPFSQVVDSFIIVNLLNRYRVDGTALFGLLTGSATTIINLPVAICYGIATSIIPIVSKEKDIKIREKNSNRARLLTLLLSIPCAIFCLIFSPFIVNLLYRNLSTFEKEITINLIRILSSNVILLSFLQTQNAILTGKGRAYSALIGLFLGVLVKIILSLILIPIEKLNIYGGAIAVFACYFTACLVNFIMDKRKESSYEVKKSFNRQLAN